MTVRRTALLLAVTALVALGAGCGGDGDGESEVAVSDPAVAVGDPVAGKTVFEQQGCGNCHTFAPAGSNRNIGPNLDEVVRRYDAAFVRESIVDPQAYVERGAGGSIGGDKSYKDIMRAFGSNAEIDENRISDQQIADLVSFLTQRP